MKYYAQYYIKNLEGKTIPMCGSDGVLPLDARYTVNNMINIAIVNKDHLIKGKYIVGIGIEKGDYRSSKQVKYIDIKAA